MFNSFICNVSVFSAARYLHLYDGRDQVPFDLVLVDTVGGFNSAKTIYTVQTAGFYFIHMSAGVPASTPLNYALHNASSTPNLILTHTTFNGELVTSRDDVQYINEGKELYISTEYPLFSDSLLQTSWSGFRLNDIMNPLIVFRAARTSPYYAINSDVLLDKLIINVGQGWDSCNSQFVAPQRGIYYFSWSAATVPNNIFVLWLDYNNKSSSIELILAAGYYNGSDTSSHSVLLQLETGDIVKLYLSYTTTGLHSSENYQISFIGFLYEPSHGNKVAWSLGFPSMPGNYSNFFGPADVTFTHVFVNEGKAWNTTTSVLKIPLDGIYFLKISGVPYPYTYKFNMIMLLNGQPLFNVMEKFDDVRTNFYNLRSRGFVKRLQAHDELKVSVPSGYNAASDTFELIFTGFLISP